MRSTCDRSLMSQLTNMAGGAVAPPAAITGARAGGSCKPAVNKYEDAPSKAESA